MRNKWNKFIEKFHFFQYEQLSVYLTSSLFENILALATCKDSPSSDREKVEISAISILKPIEESLHVGEL